MLGFIAGMIFGTLVLSTVPTTAHLINQIAPYFKQGFDFTMRLFSYLGENL